MPDRNPNVALELHCAASPFINRRATDAEARRRLRHAVVDVIRERGVDVPPELVSTPAEALDALRAIIQRCFELHVPWNEVVAIVNRESQEAA